MLQQRVKFDCLPVDSSLYIPTYETFVYTLIQRTTQNTMHHTKIRVKRIGCSLETFQRILTANSLLPLIRVEQFSRPIHGRIGRICGSFVYEKPEAKDVDVEYVALREEEYGMPDVIYSILIDSGFSH